MILSAHQPCYLPWLGWYNKLINCDLFVLLDDCQYEKGSYTNRVQIKTPNGVKWLTIPVRAKLGTKINDLESAREPWPFEHGAALYRNYKDAPWYQMWMVGVGSTSIMSTILDTLFAIFPRDTAVFRKTPIVRQHYIGVSGEKQDLIINLCKYYNADAFLFGAKGRDYVDVEYFKSQGIEPLFQDFKCIEYPQQWGGGFVPGLSVIDALFNVGPEKTLDLIKGGYSVR